MIIDTGTSNREVSEPLEMVYINDFGDRYNEYEEEKDWNDLEREAHKIKRRYRNINEYNHAVIIYCEYMSKLSISYGRRELFNLALQSGTVKEFIPPFPRLKMNKLNKLKLKKGIIESFGDGTCVVDEEEIESYIQENLNYDEENSNIYYDPEGNAVLRPIKMRTANFIEEEALNVVNDKSGGRVFSSSDRMSEVDYLEEYFRAKNIMKSKLKKRKHTDENIDYEHRLTGSDLYYHRYTTEDEENPDETVWYEGSLMTRNEIEDVNTLRYIKDLGWNALKLMDGGRRSRTSDQNKVSRHLDNIDKLQKRQKKKKKKADNFITKVLTDNKFDSFDDFASSMLDFSFQGLGGSFDE